MGSPSRGFVSYTFLEVFAHHARMGTVLAMDLTFNPFWDAILIKRSIDEIHSIEVRIFIDDARPTIDADDRYDAITGIRKGVNLPGEGIQVVLIRDDQERHHLFDRHITAETRRLEGSEQFFGFNAKPLARAHHEATWLMLDHIGTLCTHCVLL